MAILVLMLLVANGEVGQNAWCRVSMTSGTAFCDYINYGACVDANAHDCPFSEPVEARLRLYRISCVPKILLFCNG
jgi:hypothetical protein